MKDLTTVSREEFLEFLDSFNQVLCDVDGVLWLFLESIPGTDNAIKSLKKLGKKVAFVSNNSTKTLDVYYNQLKSSGFDIQKDELITPVSAMISYLRKHNVTKEIYVIGMSALKQELANAGFRLADNPPQLVSETIQEFTKVITSDNKMIEAVVVDGDINLSYIKLQRAATYLKRPEVIFVTGAPDRKLPIGKNHVLVGPGYFHQILEDIAGRKAYALAKPSLHLNEYIVEKLKIQDEKKVLFIGDSIAEDMVFASKCGYQKLLVLSGLSKEDSVDNWSYSDDYKPHYYISSLKNLYDLMLKYIADKL